MPPTIFTDTFTPGGVDLTAHTPTGGSGGPWAKHPDKNTGAIQINSAGDGLVMTAAPAVYYPSGLTPPTADYRVTGVLKAKSLMLSGSSLFMLARLVSTAGDLTSYGVRWLADATTDGAGTWQLYRLSATAGATLIGSYHEAAGTWTVGGLRTVDLDVVGSTVNVYIGGTLRISATDANVSHTGRPALYGTGTGGQSTGYQWSSMTVQDLGPQTPVNTVTPVITTDGTPQTGDSISTSNGTWSNSPTSYAYQWNRDGVAISGATSQTYTLQSADEGHSITAVVTATNAAGSASANSNTITGLPQPPANVSAPVLTTDGTPQTGETISCSTGSWTNSPASYGYQWQRNGVNIAGATLSTYALQAADEGTSVRCIVTATNTGGSGQANSNSVSALPQAPVSTASPEVTGSPFVGEVLTCSTGSWSNSPTSYAYQWRRDGSTISGATSASYTTGSADNGHALTCVVTATNSGGGTSATSNAVTIGNAPTLNDLVRFRLSGGAGNTSGQTSTGGPSGAVLSAAHGALFADVTGTQARAGLVDYRLVYIENGHDVTTAAGLRVYISDMPDSAGIELALGLAAEGIGQDVAAIPNDRTAPAGVAFSVPTTPEGGLLAGDLDPGDYRGVWVRRTIAANTPPVADDVSGLGWNATPA